MEVLKRTKLNYPLIKGGSFAKNVLYNYSLYNIAYIYF